MHAITGITGNVGGEVARALLNAGHAVRAVIRDPGKGAMWAFRLLAARRCCLKILRGSNGLNNLAKSCRLTVLALWIGAPERYNR